MLIAKPVPSTCFSTELTLALLLNLALQLTWPAKVATLPPGFRTVPDHRPVPERHSRLSEPFHYAYPGNVATPCSSWNFTQSSTLTLRTPESSLAATKASNSFDSGVISGHTITAASTLAT